MSDFDEVPWLGDYAIVELFGHTTLVGRIAEVERFGSKMLAIEPMFNGSMLPVVFHGGAAIYRLTPCSAETAMLRQPKHMYQLPPAIAAIVPPTALPVPEPPPGLAEYADADNRDDDSEEPF